MEAEVLLVVASDHGATLPSCGYSQKCTFFFFFSIIYFASTQQQNMRENKEKQALGDLMIKPVQRIPRYELLVKVTNFPYLKMKVLCVIRLTCSWLCGLGLAETHSRGTPGPLVLTRRSEGHQAAGRENQQGSALRWGGGARGQGDTGDRGSHRGSGTCEDLIDEELRVK